VLVQFSVGRKRPRGPEAVSYGRVLETFRMDLDFCDGPELALESAGL
jgi:hypothetical protein